MKILILLALVSGCVTSGAKYKRSPAVLERVDKHRNL